MRVLLRTREERVRPPETRVSTNVYYAQLVPRETIALNSSTAPLCPVLDFFAGCPRNNYNYCSLRRARNDRKDVRQGRGVRRKGVHTRMSRFKKLSEPAVLGGGGDG